jgi:hypothetical protein
MKFLGLQLAVIILFIGNAYSMTHEGVHPELRYAEGINIHQKNISSKYLVIVPESTKFPSGAQSVKFYKAVSLLDEILNSDEFKRRVISYIRSDGNRMYQKNLMWSDSKNRLSNEDVYNIIMDGNERMIQNTLGEMNLNSYVKKCNPFMSRVSVWCRKVIGSTSPGQSKWIKLNWKFYKKFEINQMVANLTHEWLHLLGFLHGNKNMREAVPYVVGSIAGQIAKEILANE